MGEQTALSKYNGNPKKCKFCGKCLDYAHRRNTFCSRSCAASFNNTGVVRHGTSSSARNLFCIFCGDPLSKRSQKKFCSNACQQKYEWDVTKKSITETGLFTAGFGNEASRPLVKKYLIERDGARCSICGITTWMGKDVPLVVDHIDGDATNCSVDNFRLVCGNCDMQLPTYKNKNQKGRKWRRQYN